MKLMRGNPSPSRDVATFHDEVSRAFDEVFARSGNGHTPTQQFIPALDVEESAEAFLVRADLPGVSKQDVKVSFADDVLTIRGERKRAAADDSAKSNLRRVERTFGAFERRLALDALVRGDKVKATYRDGVLEVHVPKADEARVHEIEVQGG